jgi:hypothetical protein
LNQQRHTGVHHERHRRVHPFHGRTRTGGQVGGAVRELPTDRTLVTKRGKLRANVFAAELRKMLHAGQPCRGPTQGFNQLARQAERQIETAYPRAGCVQAIAEFFQRRKKL